MRRKLSAGMIAALIIVSTFLAGCGATPAVSNVVAAPLSITDYKQIPGITADEISAVDNLRQTRSEFIYGTMLSSEAYVLSDGSSCGFTPRFCDFLSQIFGVKFTLKYYDWDDLISALGTGEVDFTGSLTPTAERQQTYTMSAPIAERMLKAFYLTDSKTISSENDLNGMTIGFLEGTVTAQSIRDTYPNIDFTEEPVSDYSVAMSELLSGQIGAFIDEAPAATVFAVDGRFRSVSVFPMIHSSVSLTTANHSLDPIVSVMNKYINAGGIDSLYAMYQQGDYDYTVSQLQSSFTVDEMNYISSQQGKSVPVAYESDNYPICFYNDKDKQYEGIAVDILNQVGKLTGLKFTPAVPQGTSWEDILTKLDNGQVNMVAQLIKSKVNADDYLWSAAPYANTDYALLSRSDYPTLAIYQVSHVKVGVLAGSGESDIYAQLFPDNAAPVEYNTQTECLNALKRGEIDLLMASEYTQLTENNYLENSDIRINLQLDSRMDSYFGFTKDQSLLCSIIDKAQACIDTDAVNTDWMGRMFNYTQEMLSQRAQFFAILAGTVTVLLVAAGLLVFYALRLNRRMKDMAFYDALTGAFARRYFMEIAEMQMDRSRRSGYNCYAVMIDLDHFKKVNDTHGHQAGDKVLKEAAQRVKKTIRAYDVFGRYGGEEFTILMSDIKQMNDENAVSAVERIRRAIAASPVNYNGTDIPVTASFGVARVAPDMTLEAAINCADEALYLAKEGGRNMTVLYGEKR